MCKLAPACSHYSNPASACLPSCWKEEKLSKLVKLGRARQKLLQLKGQSHRNCSMLDVFEGLRRNCNVHYSLFMKAFLRKQQALGIHSERKNFLLRIKFFLLLLLLFLRIIVGKKNKNLFKAHLKPVKVLEGVCFFYIEIGLNARVWRNYPGNFRCEDSFCFE